MTMSGVTDFEGEEEEEEEYDSKIKPLSQDEIKSIVGNEIRGASAVIDSQITEDRRRALKYYYGRPFGNEVEGRSQVVLTDVADTIEWMMPSLMRMFTGGAHVVKFSPQGPEDEKAADQATDYINHCFMEGQDGFNVLHDWFKTSLLEKVGVVKCWYEEKLEPRMETYKYLSEEALMGLLSEPGIEPIEHTPNENPDGSVTHDITVRNERVNKKIRIESIPPEEFLIAPGETKLNDETTFAAHRVTRTVSELIAMGFDRETVENLPKETGFDAFDSARSERMFDSPDDMGVGSNRQDIASREIVVVECYIRIDEDGDGYSELRRITVAGDNASAILEDVEIAFMPMFSVCPVPMPHKFYGQSMADLVSDLQLIRSTLLRQMLDNLYLLNNSRYEVVEGAVEMDDLLVSRPGGIVRTSAPGMVNPLQTQPFPAFAFNMLEYLETIRENRTGITRYNQGMDASSLNQTATGITAIMGAANARLEMVARLFAENGVKPLFKGIMKMVSMEPPKDRVIRLRGEWVEIDPSSWNSDMDVEVQVGLGVGQAAERIGFLSQLLQVQREVAMSPIGGKLVNVKNIHHTLVKLTEAMGFKVSEMFWQDPEEEPLPEQPDPDAVESQRRGATDKAKIALEAQMADMDQRSQDAKLQFEKEKMEQDLEIERMKIASKEKIELAKLRATDPDVDPEEAIADADMDSMILDEDI